MERQRIIRLTLLALAVVLFIGTQAPAQVGARQVVCPGAEIPDGWIKVDVVSSPAGCGGDAWVIETYTNKAPGSAMVVCADQPVPQGWEVLNLTTNSGQCAGGAFAGDNVKAIRRLG
jgi:hypothetical protein